jgi:hypothetical protein
MIDRMVHYAEIFSLQGDSPASTPLARVDAAHNDRRARG